MSKGTSYKILKPRMTGLMGGSVKEGAEQDSITVTVYNEEHNQFTTKRESLMARETQQRKIEASKSNVLKSIGAQLKGIGEKSMSSFKAFRDGQS